MSKNKKHHDQEQYGDQSGFREGVKKYSYHYEYQGRTIYLTDSDFDYNLAVGEFFNSSKGYFRIRRIQTNWMYGKKLVLVHLEKSEVQYV